MNDHENRVRLLIDRDVLENHQYLGCHPCINTSSLKIRTQDLLDVILPRHPSPLHPGGPSPGGLKGQALSARNNASHVSPLRQALSARNNAPH